MAQRVPSGFPTFHTRGYQVGDGGNSTFSFSIPEQGPDGFYGTSEPKTKKSGGIFNTLLKGATAIAIPILGFFGLKQFKPEWAQKIIAPIKQFTPDSVITLFNKGKEYVTKLFTGEGALAKIFKPVKDFFSNLLPTTKVSI